MSLFTTPLSLYSIPIAWIMAFYPHNVKFRLIQSTVGWDNSNPRGQDYDYLVKKGMSAELALKVGRLTGAHNNGNEISPLWAAATLAANFAGIDTKTVNVISGSFVVTRLLFNYIYINQNTKTASALRSSVWLSSIALPLYLLIVSANKARVAQL
ncbi:hypothetical protein BU17DRAFT_66508 [Hysterangium stoloniferum]|nr:hypothetical protein BU17DRAFT_66508 [Hysterangium stoloniferum]